MLKPRKFETKKPNTKTLWNKETKNLWNQEAQSQETSKPRNQETQNQETKNPYPLNIPIPLKLSVYNLAISWQLIAKYKLLQLPGK